MRRGLLASGLLGLLVLLSVVAAPLVAPRAAHAADVDATAALGEAQAHLQSGEYADAARVAGPLAHDRTLARADRAEAWRVYGLALYFLKLPVEAEAALFEYLKLEPDAHLDPALNAPETVVFLEDVRAKHAGELRKYRPRPRRGKHYASLNLLPPWGQFQNGQAAKGWAVGITELLLLTTNVTTYFMLRDRCDESNLTCGDEPDAARTLITVNLVSGALFLGVAAYGIIDGYVVYRRQRREEAPSGRISQSMGVFPTTDGAMFVLSGSF